MNAKDFQKLYFNTIKAPTERKIINLARKVGLKDTVENVLWSTGLSIDKVKEFAKQ